MRIQSILIQQKGIFLQLLLLMIGVVRLLFLRCLIHQRLQQLLQKARVDRQVFLAVIEAPALRAVVVPV